MEAGWDLGIHLGQAQWQVGDGGLEFAGLGCQVTVWV